MVTERFPALVAGDEGRAAAAFIGFRAAGDPNAVRDPKAHPGVWDLYVSHLETTWS